MFSFTKQEQTVLLVLVSVVFFGSMCEFATKKYPNLTDGFKYIEQKKSYFTVDINTASKEELIKIPYIGEYTANQIIIYRENNGPFTDIKELKEVKGIRDKNFEKFYPYIKI